MRCFLLAGVACAVISAAALGRAQAAPVGQAVHPAEAAPAAHVQQVDYYWNHRHWHHRRWHHHHWSYW